MKIIDCFTFFNELDLLEFRLKLLDPFVDHFVIAESNLTHAGKEKPYYYRDNAQRFAAWKNKILYLPLQQDAQGLLFETKDHYDPAAASWKLENEQRNALRAAIDLGSREDLFMVGDLDEIPDPVKLRSLSHLSKPATCSQLFHYYFMNCQNMGEERWWKGTILARGGDFQEYSPQELRDKRHDWPAIKKAGWHFSYLGGLEKIRQKIHSFAHTEFNRAEYTNDENILRAMKEGKDLFNRPGVYYKFFSLYFYPRYLRDLMREYPAFIYEDVPGGWFTRFAYSLKRMFS
jgi:beta-1,4-mannosyl-glycoprotein beta-1,4-N-acetylglucosaminyltransferase